MISSFMDLRIGSRGRLRLPALRRASSTGTLEQGGRRSTIVQTGLDDVAGLLRDLNEGRKSVAYGDVDLPDLSAEEIATKIEEYVESVSGLIERGRVQ